jgi:hypothetical protein
MLRTIILGSCTLVQGVFVRQFDDGRIAIRVGRTIFRGFPVGSASAA